MGSVDIARPCADAVGRACHAVPDLAQGDPARQNFARPDRARDLRLPHCSHRISSTITSPQSVKSVLLTA